MDGNSEPRTIFVNARRARLTDARLMYKVLEDTFYPFGYMVSLHGSTLDREEGRDIDFIFTRWREDAISIPDVLRRLRAMSFEDKLHEANRGKTRDAIEMCGIVGLWHGFVVDITFPNPPFGGWDMPYLPR